MMMLNAEHHHIELPPRFLLGKNTLLMFEGSECFALYISFEA